MTMTAISRFKRWLLMPPVDGARVTALMRLMVGGVFVSEGIQKFIYPSLGVVRFRLLGFPLPAATAALVGGWEIIGGCLLILGLLTRAVAIPFVVEMIVAILSTKVSMFLGTSPLPLPPVPPQVGFWAVLHDGRSDLAQILTSLFLLFVGPGLFSLDARLRRSRAGVAQGSRREAGAASGWKPTPVNP